MDEKKLEPVPHPFVNPLGFLKHSWQFFLALSGLFASGAVLFVCYWFWSPMEIVAPLVGLLPWAVAGGFVVGLAAGLDPENDLPNGSLRIQAH